SHDSESAPNALVRCGWSPVFVTTTWNVTVPSSGTVVVSAVTAASQLPWAGSSGSPGDQPGGTTVIVTGGTPGNASVRVAPAYITTLWRYPACNSCVPP